MDGLTSTSFDRNARYRYVLRLRSEHFGPEPIRVLDVGDPYGILQALLPNDNTVSLDLFKEGQPLAERHSHIIGSGFQLPFPDRAFDIVATHDVLEHLPSGTHAEFAQELRRVSRGPVVLVAPFADVRTARCEEIANTYYAARTGHTLQPLDEHAEGDGLPSLDALLDWATDSGIPTVAYSGGWLGHWLMMMMLKAHFAASGDIVADRSFDTAFNLSLQERDDLSPHYRRAVILDPPYGVAPSSMLQSDTETVSRQSTELTEIAWKVAGALLPGAAPQLPGSSFRSLWDRPSTPGGGIADELAISVRRLMSEMDLRQNHGSADAGKSRPSLAIIVAVMDRDLKDVHACIARLIKQVEIYGPAELVVAISKSQDIQRQSLQSPQLRWVDEEADDFILRLNAAVATCSAECLVFVDPLLEVPADFLQVLTQSYAPGEGVTCVAPHVRGGSSALLHLPDIAGEVFFAPKQAMLIARSTYVGLAGFDGSLRGAFDDLDLGWRLRTIGQRVACVDLWCDLPDTALNGTSVDSPTLRLALYRILLKNCERVTLADALGRELLNDLDDVEPAGLDFLPLQRDHELITQQRKHVQAARQCGDAQITGRFGVPSLSRQTDRKSPGSGSPIIAFLGNDASLLGLVRSVGVLRTSSHTRILDIEEYAVRRSEHLGTTVVILPARLLASFVTIGILDEKLIVDLTEAPPDFGVPSSLLRRVSAFICSTSTQSLFWRARLGALLGHEGSPEIHVASVAPQAPVEQHFGESGISDTRRHPVVLDCRNNHDREGLRTLAGALLSSPELDLSEVVVLGSSDQELLAFHGIVPTTDATSSFLQAQVVVRHVVMDDTCAKLASTFDLLQPYVCGTPIVTTTQDPAAEFILQDGGGFVSHDASGILAGVQRILNDPLTQAGTVAGLQRTIATTQRTASRRLNQLIDDIGARL